MQHIKNGKVFENLTVIAIIQTATEIMFLTDILELYNIIDFTEVCFGLPKTNIEPHVLSATSDAAGHIQLS